MSGGIRRETVREMNGRVIGYVDMLPNGDKEIRDKYNRYIGKYDNKDVFRFQFPDKERTGFPYVYLYNRYTK